VAVPTPDQANPVASLRPQFLGGRAGRKIDLRGAKDEARRSLAKGSLGRELVLSLPDLIEEIELDALFPMLVRLIRERSREPDP
jgi:hypothetical protein